MVADGPINDFGCRILRVRPRTGVIFPFSYPQPPELAAALAEAQAAAGITVSRPGKLPVLVEVLAVLTWRPTFR